MSEEKRLVLMAEDDESLGFILKEYLEMKGFKVDHAVDGKAALKFYEKGKYDFLLLDVMMPKLDGFGVAEQIRKDDQDLPIVFITAKSMQEDKLKGLKIGADDYITKPFSMEELQLRMSSILKRVDSQKAKRENQTEYEIGIFHFNRLHKTISQNGEEQKLTDKEAALLEMLIQHKNETMPRKDALIKIWGDDDYFNGRSMDVYITKLRKILKRDEKLLIENIHGVGYCLIEKS